MESNKAPIVAIGATKTEHKYNYLFGLYDDAKSNIPSSLVTLDDIAESIIRDPALRSKTEKYRLTEKNRQDSLKVSFRCVTYATSTNRAKGNKNWALSGYIAYDIDHLTEKQMEEVRAELPLIFCPALMHVTLSGLALRIVFRLDIDLSGYREAWEAGAKMLKAELNVIADPKCKDIGRLYFINHDSQCFHSESSGVINDAFIAKWGESGSGAIRQCVGEGLTVTLSNEQEILALSLMKEVTDKYGIEAVEGRRNSYTNQLAIICKENGLPEAATAEYILPIIEEKCGYKWEESRPVFASVYSNPQILAPKKIVEEDYYIDFDMEYPEPVAMLSYQGVLFGSEGNISTVIAKQKVGKSFFTSMVEAAFISGRYGGLEGEGCTEIGGVLHFDTEQSKPHIALMQSRLYRMLGWDEKMPQIRFYGLRELSVKDRITYIEKEALKYKPRLIVIDGAVDLCADFNSIEKSNETLHFLMKLSSQYKNHILTVIHENKGDSNARGHCGSFLMQRSETVIQLAKSGNGDFIDVTFPYTRNKSPDKFHFEISEGLPKELVVAEQIQSSSNYGLFYEILKVPMSYSNLRMELMQRQNIKESAAEKQISKAAQSGFIKRDTASKYSFADDFTNSEYS